MRIIGKVKEVWRYPVKSMGGQPLAAVYVAKSGLVGDRLWAVLDAHSGEIKSARQWPALIGFRAGYAAAEPSSPALFGSAVPAVRISGDDGFCVDSSAADVDERLSQRLGKPCRLAALMPPEQRDHYRLVRARDMEEVFREIDLLPDEGIPDFSGTPEAMYRLLEQYVTPPGTYFDSFPLHLVSTRTLNVLARRGQVDTAVPRFRPNLVLELDDDIDAAEVAPEMTWTGATLRIGAIDIVIETKTLRCSIPSRAQPQLGVEAESRLTRAMVDVLQRHVGVYASVLSAGTVKVGDAVSIGAPA